MEGLGWFIRFRPHGPPLPGRCIGHPYGTRSPTPVTRATLSRKRFLLREPGLCATIRQLLFSGSGSIEFR